MVLYHANGRVVKAHEDYLEREAKKVSDTPYNRHLDPIEVAKQKGPEARNQQNRLVHIVADVQFYGELFVRETSGFQAERLDRFSVKKRSGLIPRERGLDRRSLMRCPSFADDFFTYHHTADLLRLPVCYPRMHLFGLSDYQGPNDWPKFERDFKDRLQREDISSRKELYHSPTIKWHTSGRTRA
jgi:hypothetical protein